MRDILRIHGFAAAGVIALAVLPVAACSLVYESPSYDEIAIGSINGEFNVAVCTDIHVSSITMKERESGGSWSDFWTFESSFEIARGDTLSPGAADELNLPAGTSPRLGKHDQIFVQISSSDPDYRGSMEARFEIKKDLNDGSWLHSDGSVTELPCAS